MRTPLMLVTAVALSTLAAHAQQPAPRATPPAAVAAAVDRTVATYAAAWGEPSLAARRELLHRVWASQATYTDPTVRLAGLEALARHISEFQAKLPGATIVPTTKVDAHHGSIRFGWRILSASGTALSEGMDYGEVDAAGRITRIIGFFGALEPAAPRAPR